MALKKEDNATDFQEKALAVEQHGKDLTDHSDRITVLENKLSSPEQIALLLELASKDSKKMDRLFADIFTSMLKDEKCNPEVHQTIEDIINKTDRDFFNKTIKKWGKLLGTALIFILGTFFTIIVEWLKKKIGL